MKTIMKFKSGNELKLPEKYDNDDVRYSDDFVQYFIKEYTEENDVVLDPFAGFGTTLYNAEKLNRIGIGIEYISDRVDYIKTIIKNKENILHGSSLNINQFELPIIDLSITSPPYMSRNNHKEYPFAGYEVTGDGYDKYLKDIKKIYLDLKKHMKKDAYIILEVSNIINDGEVTTLAWDITKVVSEVFKFEKEIILNWDYNSFGYDHSYCLIFKNAK